MTARVVGAVKRFYGRDRLDGTLPSCIILAGALTLLPVSILIFQNRGTIAAPMAILQVGVAGAVITSVLTLVLSRWLAPHVAGIFLGVLGYAFFSLSWVSTSSTLGLINTWLAVAVAMSAVLIWLASDSRLLVHLATAASVVGSVVLLGVSLGESRVEGAQPDALAFEAPLVRRPNIYLFVLDAFGRPDVLTETLGDVGLNLDRPIEQLEQLGFENETRASANYIETNLSIPSTLNAEFHHTPETPMAHFEHWSRAVSALAGNNATVATLRNAGYEYWHSGSGIWDHAACDVTVADRCLGKGVTAFESRTAIWNETPFRGFFVTYDESLRQDPLKVADQILAERSSRDADEPYFVFAHFLLPHSPYALDRDCSSAPENSSTLTKGSKPEHRRLYADQTMCVADQLVGAMQQILAVDPDAIVLLQGDHGPAFSVDLDADQWSEESIIERLSPFRMTRLPAECRSSTTAAQSLVNTLPMLTACLTGTEPQLIPPSAFTSAYKAEVGPVEIDVSLVTG